MALNLIFAIVLSGLLVAEAARGQDVVIADELRTAYFERAPRGLARSMSKAVSEWCSTDSGGPEAEAVGWLCQHTKAMYFRSVYINGERGFHGLVCRTMDSPRFKYVGMDVVEESLVDGECVPVERGYDAEYALYVDRIGGDVE
ncbi:MAG: hypothetical protein H6978_16180 [Gammaproteobacteria bacterium]|nr:hypothetical protein [Gammaproteobacteria bacterium]